MILQSNHIEIIKELYASPLIDTRAAPFSETEILTEQNPDVKKAMIYVMSLLALKVCGKSKKTLAEDERKASLLGKSLAKICAAKKLNRSQCIAIINQLFQ